MVHAESREKATHDGWADVKNGVAPKFGVRLFENPAISTLDKYSIHTVDTNLSVLGKRRRKGANFKLPKW
jgi:hypothetical protein